MAALAGGQAVSAALPALPRWYHLLHAITLLASAYSFLNRLNGERTIYSILPTMVLLCPEPN